jgi:hypothetical protein
MSTTPYNNLIVNDLNTNQQPYVNSTTEVGYFSNVSTNFAIYGAWYSLNTNLNTNNGIATLGLPQTNNMYGLKILNPGIYKINLSFFPSETSSNGSAISFNFGTAFQNGTNTSNNDISGFGREGLGNYGNYGMYTYGPANINIPGIISWIANGYNSINTSPSSFLIGSNIAPVSGNLRFTYNADATSGTGGGVIFNGICSTEITFFVTQPNTTIYFNVISTNGVVMGNCYFTLQLMSTYNVST